MNRLILSLLPCTALVGACAGTVDIDARDKTRFSSFAASLPIEGNENLRVRLQATRVDGSFGQSLDTGETIRLGDADIAGPDEVDGKLELAYYSIAIGGSRNPGESVRTETYFGISQTRFDLDIANDTSRLEAADDTVELYLQFATYAALTESMDFGFRWAFSTGSGLSGISEIDLLLDYRIAEHLTLSGGYRWFDYQYESDIEDSNIVVDLQGPFLGIQIPF